MPVEVQKVLSHADMTLVADMAGVLAIGLLFYVGLHLPLLF